MSVLRAALLELADALDAGADALVQTADSEPDRDKCMEMYGKASGYSEAASDIRSTLEDYRNGDEK